MTILVKPCFIDKDNNICAVGYLIEQTIDRDVANKINSRHKYDYVLAMNDKRVDNWILTSGLTKKEFAMIQPAYGPVPVENYNYIEPMYGLSSALIGGVNLSLSTINGIQINNGTTSKFVSKIGIISGAGQVVLGLINFPNEEKTRNLIVTNESQKKLALLNIGIGTSTIILSVWNRWANKKRQEKLTTWNIYSFPTENNENGVAFTLTRKF
jgi:hypothetical protein